MKTLKRMAAWIGMIGFLVAVGYSFYFLYKDGVQVWLVVLIAVYVFNAIFALGLFSQRRHPQAKLSWLIVMIVAPGFGHVIFLLFGRRFKNRVHLEKYLGMNSFTKEDLTPNEKIKDYTATIFGKQSVKSNRGTYNGDVEFINNGIDAFETMFNDMRNAKEFIHIHFYIIHPGEIYDEFKSILIQKAKEGIKIRFIVDDFGRWAMPWYAIKELETHGVEIEVFGKVSFPFIGSQNGYRTHRKMVIIDGRTVHTGGMNIGDEYANLDKKYGNWVDFQIKITGKAVRSFSLLFITDWKLIKGVELDYDQYLKETDEGKSQMVLVEDGPLVVESVIGTSIVSWILAAKESVSIATPYFIPTHSITEALKSAAMSGVKVTIYLPGKADKKSVLIASRHWAKELIPSGVEFKKVNDMLIHSKMAIFDNEYAYAGTANIDMRSIYSQFEFVSLLHGPAVKGVANLFKTYDEMSTYVGLEELDRFRPIDRIVRILVSIFSPVM